VGDLIRIHDGQLVPADCILVQIENESKEAFVKTVPLDGERNLKPKLECKYLSQNFAKIFDPSKSVSTPIFKVETVLPVKDLYSYRAQLDFEIDGHPHQENIDLNTFLHAAAFLEDSKSVIGLVIHTGRDTKIQMNMGKYHYKMSRFEKYLNAVLIINLVIAFALNLINLGLWKGFTTKSIAEIKPGKHYLWYKILVDGKVPKIKLAI